MAKEFVSTFQTLGDVKRRQAHVKAHVKNVSVCVCACVCARVQVATCVAEVVCFTLFYKWYGYSMVK